MLRSLLIFLLFFLTLQGALAQQYNVRGFVSNEKTGEAVSNEKVTLLSEDSALVAGAMTDQNGLFSIPKLNPGSYILRLRVSGYKKTFIPIKLQGDKKIVDVSRKKQSPMLALLNLIKQRSNEFQYMEQRAMFWVLFR